MNIMCIKCNLFPPEAMQLHHYVLMLKWHVEKYDYARSLLPLQL